MQEADSIATRLKKKKAFQKNKHKILAKRKKDDEEKS